MPARRGPHRSRLGARMSAAGFGALQCGRAAARHVDERRTRTSSGAMSDEAKRKLIEELDGAAEAVPLARPAGLRRRGRRPRSLRGRKHPRFLRRG